MTTAPMFFTCLQRHGANIALVEGETRLNYQQLQTEVEQFRSRLPKQALVIIKARNSIATIVAYLACLQSATPMLLVDEQIDEAYLQRLFTQFNASALINDGEIELRHNQPLNIDSRLALLLSTSGSTGSPKQVALSAANLQANAQAICGYLPILATDNTITTLAPHYSYGLSVINSHLLAGATIVLNEHSLISREFWQLFEDEQINSFAGVPFSYEMLLRLRFTQKSLPSLRYFTQAGGKLSEDKVLQLAEYATNNNKAFFVMYGQTEATARIAYNAQPERKPNSIGKVIPGGELYLLNDSREPIAADNQSGELYYRGDNVMLGYVEGIEDLIGFKANNTLATGDIAYRDADGDYVISGRLKRIIKPFGMRINLDEVEQRLADKGYEVAATGDDNGLLVAVCDPQFVNPLREYICQWLSLHPSMVNVVAVITLPRTTSNKIDYHQLTQQLHDTVSERKE